MSVDRGGGGPAVQRVAFGRINIVSSCVCGQSKKNGRRKFSPRGKCKCCGSNVNEERVPSVPCTDPYSTPTVCGCQHAPLCLWGVVVGCGGRHRHRRSMGSIRVGQYMHRRAIFNEVGIVVFYIRSPLYHTWQIFQF